MSKTNEQIIKESDKKALVEKRKAYENSLWHNLHIDYYNVPTKRWFRW